jgi:hypothetical protein
MCIAALPLLGAVMSIAQAGVGYAAASQQAKEQNAYYERNRQAALAAMRDKYASIQNNTLQEREVASQELLTKRIEAVQKRSTAMVAAGDKGTTGLSVDALWQDFAAQQARQANAILTNYQNKKERNMDEGEAAYHNTIGRINSVRQAAKPSAAAFMIQGLSGAVGAIGKAG